MKVLVAWEDQGLHTMIGEMENDHIGNSVNISEGTKVRVTILKDTHSYEEWLQPELHGRVTSTGIQVEKQPTDVPLSALVQRQVPSAQSYLKIYNEKLAKTVLRASDHGYIQIAIGGLIQEHRVDLDSFEQGKILKLPERSYMGSQLQFLTSIMLRVEFQDLQYYFEMSLQFGENILLIPMKFSYGRQSPLETHQFGTVHPVTEGIRKSMKFVKYWFLALRAPQYLITFLSIIVGTALTEGQINFSYFLLIVLGTFLVQSGGNLLNDYLDFRSELDELDIIQDQKTISRRFLRDRLLHPQIAISTGGMMFIVGLIIGIYLNTITPGNIVLLLGVVGALTTYFYTGSPLKLAYRGVGEVILALNFGPFIILGTYYVLSGQLLEWNDILYFCLSPLLIVTSLLIINELGDLEVDTLVSKNTIVVRTGKTGSLVLVGILLLISFIFAMLLQPTILPVVVLTMGLLSIFWNLYQSIQTERLPSLARIVLYYVIWVIATVF